MSKDDEKQGGKPETKPAPGPEPGPRPYVGTEGEDGGGGDSDSTPETPPSGGEQG